jgi:RHS repeat-associated protein
VIRIGYGGRGHWNDPFVVVPHANWRDVFDTGSFETGAYERCRTYRVDAEPDLDCIAINWPAENTAIYFELVRSSYPRSWMGSLLRLQRDATGELYRRNRYYDPVRGRFTQEDPIGLAGGLNLYGYANGDPVNFSDPFGLKADTLEAVRVTHRSREVPTTTYGTLCVDSSVRDNVQQIYDLAVSIGIPVDFNNAYRDRNTAGTGGRPGAGGSSQHLAGFAFDINSSSLTAAQNAEFARIAGSYGLTPVRGDPGHYQVTGGGARRYGSHQAAVNEARRSYAAGECTDQNVEAVRAR